MEHFFFLQLIANQKIIWVTDTNDRFRQNGLPIPMIDLGKSKEVTTVLNFKLNFFQYIFFS